MARFESIDLAQLMLDFSEIATLPDDVLEDMVDAEADVIVDGTKTVMRTMGVRDTGALIDSIKQGKTSKTGDGMQTYVYPQGSRRRYNTTTRNAEIGFINEFGKQGQAARPVFLTANERYADRAVDAAYKVYDKYLSSKNL